MANEIATLNSKYVDICVWIFEILAQVFSKPEQRQRIWLGVRN